MQLCSPHNYTVTHVPEVEVQILPCILHKAVRSLHAVWISALFLPILQELVARKEAQLGLISEL